jgi:hypothetical protein
MFRYLTMMVLLALAIPASRADDDTNRGQVVSDCNQRANARNLTGQDRQDFVDRCVTRHDTFGDDQADRRSDCKARAAERGLRDEARRAFMDRCIGGDDRASDDRASDDRASDDRAASHDRARHD